MLMRGFPAMLCFVVVVVAAAAAVELLSNID